MYNPNNPPGQFSRRSKNLGGSIKGLGLLDPCLLLKQFAEDDKIWPGDCVITPLTPTLLTKTRAVLYYVLHELQIKPLFRIKVKDGKLIITRRYPFTNLNGYIQVKCSFHPTKKSQPWHRMVAEHAIGNTLPEGAVIHHINGDITDNRPENLQICKSRGEHTAIHRKINSDKREIKPAMEIITNHIDYRPYKPKKKLPEINLDDFT